MDTTTLNQKSMGASEVEAALAKIFARVIRDYQERKAKEGS